MHLEKMSPLVDMSLLKKAFISGDLCGKFWKKS